MSDSKLKFLPESTSPSEDDLVYIVDVSEPISTADKSSTIKNLVNSVNLVITNVDDTYVVLETDEWIRCDGNDTINGASSQIIYTLDSLFILDAADGEWDAR